MKKTAPLLIVLFLTLSSYAMADVVEFYNSTDDFMKKYVKSGRVDYASVKKNFSEIETLYNNIGAIDLEGLDAASKKAFFLNAYNLIVIYQISKYYPLKSPMDQSGFFDRVKHNIAGERLTLNELEIKKIILTYKDPRIHFALACAAVSCPQLASFAYVPDKLDDQLDQRTKKAVNDDTFIRVDGNKKKVDISEIFKWYMRDFTANGNSVLSFINKYRTEEIPSTYAQGYYQYDWNLNDM